MTKKDYVKQIFSLTSNSADRWMRTMPSTGSAGRRVELTMKNYNRWSEKQLAGRANTIRTSLRKKQKKETAKKVQEQVMRVRPERGYYVQNVPKGTRLGDLSEWAYGSKPYEVMAELVVEGYEFSDEFEDRYENGSISFEEVMLERAIQDKEQGLNIKNWRERAIKRQKIK
tara:strand:+ start:1434 stop:1946 length:513 start_codon:yes stop_codon:yes gene_type:complete